MKISIFGTGYVGLVTGTCLAELGNEVLCIDTNRDKIEKLKEGIIPIYEPGLKELVERNIKEKRLFFSTESKKGIEFGKVIFNAVGTPLDENNKANLSYVKEVAKTVGQYIDDYKILVNKSTVPVGTADICRKIIKTELAKRKKKIIFDVVSNPEFLREGSAIKDTMTPERIVVGTDSEKARTMLEKLYLPITRIGKPLVFTDIKSAEIIKYAANCFLAMKISFINEFSNFCELAGGDIKEIAKGIGLDSRIGPRFLQAGIGYGGSCFHKDIQAIINKGKEFGFTFEILEKVEKVNERQIEILIRKLKKHIKTFQNKTIAIWGLSFKPKTDDIREAPALKIIKKLIKEGAKIQAFDPVAMPNTRKVFPKIYYAKDSYDAAKGADALILATEWDEFRSIDLNKVKAIMRKKIIIDGRNIYDQEIK